MGVWSGPVSFQAEYATRSITEALAMGHYEQDETPIEVPPDRLVIGMVYLVLSGLVFTGLLHLLAQG